MFMGVLNVLLAGYGFHNPITYTCTGLYIAIDTKGFIGGRGGGVDDKAKNKCFK